MPGASAGARLIPLCRSSSWARTISSLALFRRRVRRRRGAVPTRQYPDAQGRPLERIGFLRPRQFGITDNEYTVFGQDHWIVRRAWRWIWVFAPNRSRFPAPFAWRPAAASPGTSFAARGTTLRAGFGFFYEHVPLNVYWFNRYPDQVITTYDPAGEITSGPTVLSQHSRADPRALALHLPAPDRRQFLAAQRELERRGGAAAGHAG